MSEKNNSVAADAVISDEEILAMQDQVGDDGFGGGSAPRKAKAFWPSAMRLFKELAPHRIALIVVVAMVVISVVLTVYAPKVLGKAMDVLFSGVMSSRLPAGMPKDVAVEHARQQGNDRMADMFAAMDLVPGQGIDFSKLGTILMIVLGMYLVSALFMWMQGLIMNRLVVQVVYDLRRKTERKINNLPLNYFDTRQRGDILSRTTNDIDNVQQALQQAFSQLIESALLIIGIGIMMFVVSWQLALIALLTLPLAAVIIGVIGSKSQKLFATQWRATGSVNGHIEETFTGHDLVRVFGRSDDMQKIFDERNEELYESASKAQFYSGMMMPVMQWLTYLSYVGIAVVGGLRVASGSMSLGNATAFIQYSREFNQPLGQLAGMMNQLQSGVASAERVFELLDAEEQTPDFKGVTNPAVAQAEKVSQPDAGWRPEKEEAAATGLVEFHNVNFSYSPDHPLIENLNLKVKPGQTAAIVGPTGAGKTTLVNLIMRFYEIDSGAITLDGVDIRDISRASLRAGIGMVLQDAVLFEGTIMENIRYGRLDATDEEVIAAAKATYVNRFVHALPDGYDTKICEEGGAISAGERQLITIARAFLSQPELLILDEATSSVDTRTELLIQQAMSALQSDKTSFVIAHRLSTIRDADVIIVMENGSVVEQGTHDELINADGAYAKLYESQFSEPEN